MGLTFDQPYLLVLLPLGLGLVFWLWRTSRVYLPRVRRYAALWLRMTGVTLLVLVLAGPRVQLHASDLAVAILLDRSDSISPAQRDQEEQWLADALAHKAPHDRVAVVSFAGLAALERPLSEDPTPPLLASDTSLQGSRTDIAAAVRVGLGVLPSDAARRIVLLSDGNQNAGDAQTAAQLASAAGVPLETVALGQNSGPQALVEALDAPARLHEGDKFSVTAQIRSTDPMSATLRLLVDDQLVASQDVQLQAGANRFLLPVDSMRAGNHVLRLLMEADGDPRTQNKSGGAYVIVDGPPSVLIVEGAPGEGQYLAQALQAADLKVDVTSPQAASFQPDVLNGYSSVILANVPANLLPPSEMDALKNYVQTHGGGLVVTGGDQAYGPGGYARTPLEDVLPVSTDLRGSSISVGTALVLVIDTSGSMSENVGGTTIMEQAKAAALSAAEMLGPGDQIGVIAFEDPSKWAIQPTPANNLDAIDAAVGQMQPGGGDDTDAAGMQLAYDALAPIDSKNKHIILITDGQNPGGDYNPVLQKLLASGVSLSTIGIGNQADTQLLQQLAQQGNGAYYDGSDPFNLPQLVVKETQQLQRAAIVEKDTQAVAIGQSPVLNGLDPSQLPPLRGYVATTPKPQSSVILSSTSADPLLTEWQYGLGRVVAWTSDVTNRWSAGWLAAPKSYGPFWSQVVKHTIRPPEDPNRQVAVSISGDVAHITLDALSGAEGTDRSYVNFLPTSAAIVDPAGAPTQIALPQVGPGQYAAALPVQTDGVYTLQVTESNVDGSQSTQSSGFVVPYSPEYRDLATNETLLSALAAQTGGKPISSPDEAFAHDLSAVGAAQPVWYWLLMLLALVLVADVGVRRLQFSGRDAQAAYQGVRKRLGYVDERPSRGGVRTPERVAPLTPLVGRHASVPPAAQAPQMPSASRRPAPGASMGQQLLAAKRRAAKR